MENVVEILKTTIAYMATGLMLINLSIRPQILNLE